MTRALVAAAAAASLLGTPAGAFAPPRAGLTANGVKRHAGTTATATTVAPLPMEKGAGGMFDTRNPDAMDHEDPRKSISAAPSFEEYMKSRAAAAGGGDAGAAGAAAPAAPAWGAPAASAPPAAPAQAGPSAWGAPAAAEPPAAAGPPPAWGAPAAAAVAPPAWGAPAAAAPPAQAGPPAWGAPAAAAPAQAGPPAWGAPAAAAPAAPAQAAAPPAWGAPPAAAAAPPAPAAPAPAAAVGGGGGASAAGATSALQASQSAILDRIAASIPDLAPKPDLSWPSGGTTIGGSPAALDGRDAPGPSNVAWISALTVDGAVSGLTVFNGPLNDVPHLVSRCSVDEAGGEMTYDLDFRPRAYGAYELVDGDGNYPGPETLGRKAFEYSGARNDYFGKFCDDEVRAFFESTKGSFEGAAPSDAPLTEFDGLTRGPLALSLSMPLTETNVAAVAAAQEKAAEYWLSWATDGSHEHRPGAPVNTQYVYDAKFRQNAYSALLPKFVSRFGEEDGAKLAAADSGPLDEAYVGGGS